MKDNISKKNFVGASFPDDKEEGYVKCIISTFNIVDRDGDVVLPGAIENGTPVKLCSWGHKWGELPVGRGVITVTDNNAIFEGKFFTDTAVGRETYLTVKNMGDLQEWSWGFKIDKSELGTKDGRRVRFISKTTPFEVSPVLIGANQVTRTLDIKGVDEDELSDQLVSEKTNNIEESKETEDEAIEVVHDPVEEHEEKATWDAAYVNNLPDSAFAVILPGGTKDDEGKTTPRSLRKLPHHDSDGSVDLPHLRNALSRLPQTDLTDAQKSKAESHLEKHAKDEHVGEPQKDMGMPMSGGDMGMEDESDPDAAEDAKLATAVAGVVAAIKQILVMVASDPESGSGALRPLMCAYSDMEFFFKLFNGEYEYDPYESMGIDEVSRELKSRQLTEVLKALKEVGIEPIISEENSESNENNDNTEENGIKYSKQGEKLLADFEAFIGRTKSLADLRVKEGRVLSTANRNRLVSIKEGLAQASSALEQLLADTDVMGPDAETEKQVPSKSRDYGRDIRYLELLNFLGEIDE